MSLDDDYKEDKDDLDSDEDYSEEEVRCSDPLLLFSLHLTPHPPTPSHPTHLTPPPLTRAHLIPPLSPYPSALSP